MTGYHADANLRPCTVCGQWKARIGERICNDCSADSEESEFSDAVARFLHDVANLERYRDLRWHAERQVKHGTRWDS